jgi:hypothetical protein
VLPAPSMVLRLRRHPRRRVGEVELPRPTVYRYLQQE